MLGTVWAFLPGRAALSRYSAGIGSAEEQPHRLPVHLMLTLSACSGQIAQTAPYPLDVVRRQMQVGAVRLCGALLWITHMMLLLRQWFQRPLRLLSRQLPACVAHLCAAT